MMPTLISMYDNSGVWARPWYEAGYDVLCLDLEYTGDMLETFGFVQDAVDVDVILAAVPCTCFAASGAWTWPAKDAETDPLAHPDGAFRSQETDKALLLAELVEVAVEIHRPRVWAVENPVGRLARLCPWLGGGWWWNPSDFSGWVAGPRQLGRLDAIRAKDGEGVTPAEVGTVMACEAYTKKTGIWGEFTAPEKRPVEPVKVCRQGSPIQRFGGKSARTKRKRSVTPAGFARAFCEANL